MNTLDKITSLNMNRNKLPGLINKLRAVGDVLSDKECEYKKLLSEEAIRLHREEGTVWSVCESIAKGIDRVAIARKLRDKLNNEYLCIKTEIKAVMLELELQNRELEREYKVRRVG